MMKIILLRIAIILCFCLNVTTPVHAERFPGREVIITDGRSDRAAKASLVVVMHGFLGTARNMQKKSRFDALARRYGFIVAYPNGKGRKWNDGRSASDRVDDVGYITALISGLIADGRVDPNRVYLTGHSNGGGMAMRMACDRPDLVAAIAVVATKSPIKFQCPNGSPVPALFLHGTEDPISPHGGRSGASRLGGALSSAATLEIWQRRNGCRGVARRQSLDARDDGTSVQISGYAGCAAALTYVEITGHGHDWPRPGARSTQLQGPATQEVDGAELVWRFFDAQK